MNVQQYLQSLAERVSTSASVRTIYGDPVVAGDRTVIPVARIRYGFGGGGGTHKGEEGTGGGGGGGGVMAHPAGVVEISPAGTRYIAFDERRAKGLALALGFLLGAAVVGFQKRCRSSR
jgi:uncharacterized spore protein YtfJ